MNNDSLYHHGIKGQKWGVRRFQNKDGSLTVEGKKRLDERYEISGRKEEKELNKQMRDADLKKAGVENGVIKAGSEIYRLANKDETLDNKAKYVSVTNNDRSRYGEAFDVLGIDMDRPWGEYTYIAKHDLKIADADKVLDHVLEKYGDVKLKNLYKTVNDYSGIQDYSYKYKKEYKDKDHVELEDPGYYVGEAKGQVIKRLNDIMTTNISEIGKHFEKQGYEGFVDIEDYGLFADYPVILSTPVNSIELKKYEKYGWLD